MNQKDFFNFDGNVRRIQREPLTPYKIAVLTLIKIFYNDKRKDIAERRDFCIASLKLIQSPDMRLDQLYDLLYSEEYMLLRFVCDLKSQLTAIYTEDIDKLLDLFESLPRLMEPNKEHAQLPPVIHKTSVLGLYVRRMFAMYESLDFDDLIVLYEDFQNYVKEWEEVTPSTSKSLLECSSYRSRNAWAGKHAELAIAQQAHALQTDEHKALPPKKLQTLIEDLIQCSPYNAEAHYLSYLNCLRVNEYCGAIDSLYHCFDTLAPLENRSSPEDKSQMFRFAALNLAALHVQFNHKEVAKEALKEAIMMAQEAGDNVCLQLAHAWMYNLIDEKKGSLIERSIGKATSLGITPTQSLGFIAFAHNAAMEAKNPKFIFETLMNSDLLNFQNSMLDLISVTYVERAALWAYYGKTEMSSVCSQLLLLYNSSEKKQYMFNGPSTCQAVVNIANILVEFGEYQQANLCLSHAKQRFPNEPSKKIWMLSERLYEFTKLMHHEKWSEAEVIAKEISSLDPLESLFRLVDVCIAEGDYPRALNLVNKIDKTPNITAQNRVRSMILSSQIDCASIFPGKGLSGCNSLLLLNSALELAASNHLSYYGALIKMHMANIQLLMKKPYDATKLVDEAIVQILAHGGLFDQGRAFVLHAKCLMVRASEMPAASKSTLVLDAVKSLAKAKAAFEKVEAFGRVKSALYLLCAAYNELQMKPERNQCAFESRKLDQQFPSKSDKMCLY